jgi:hypothetical protein
MMMDFAPNVRRMGAMANITAYIPFKHNYRMFSHTDDRIDYDIINMTTSPLKMQADVPVMTEFKDYL